MFPDPNAPEPTGNGNGHGNGHGSHAPSRRVGPWLRWRDPAKRKQAGQWWLFLAIGYTALMGLVAVLPLGTPKVSGFSLDKLAHLGEYWIFTWLVFRAVRLIGMPRQIGRAHV